ncbi:MAG: hypothetical protein HND40_00190 [Ignavibacteriota bacterium]|nr:hypothetical protein [Ignavibacteriota bacterium]MCO6447990.1 hypothetical protein [Ignavibacterium album]MCZ2268391.1 hypothetical protein [Ignavibacteriales bacterium]QKJ98082.1 MAG: hypothetical protein HND40_00190 [Ignavibacteriota bacterium]HOJ06771.1 hypothetical protein [Ignavibacteriaceae bacterium]
MTRDKKNIGKRNNTMTNTLVNKIGLEEVEQLWIQYGCYKAADELSKMLNQYVSFSTIRYLSQALDWKRPVNPKSAIYKGVKVGTVSSSYYKHLIFPEWEKIN